MAPKFYFTKDLSLLSAKAIAVQKAVSGFMRGGCFGESQLTGCRSRRRQPRRTVIANQTPLAPCQIEPIFSVKD